jgi:hypothetical protein
LRYRDSGHQPEDLIIAKVLTGPAKDIEDIRGVIHERRKSLDEERVRWILRLLEQALGQSDLLPIFERAWSQEELPKRIRKTRRSVRKPEKK